LEGMVVGSNVHVFVHLSILTLLVESRAHSPRGSTRTTINNYLLNIVTLNVRTFFVIWLMYI
jgi:hypothetical protein